MLTSCPKGRNFVDLLRKVDVLGWNSFHYAARCDDAVFSGYNPVMVYSMLLFRSGLLGYLDWKWLLGTQLRNVPVKMTNLLGATMLHLVSNGSFLSAEIHFSVLSYVSPFWTGYLEWPCCVSGHTSLTLAKDEHEPLVHSTGCEQTHQDADWWTILGTGPVHPQTLCGMLSSARYGCCLSLQAGVLTFSFVSSQCGPSATRSPFAGFHAMNCCTGSSFSAMVWARSTFSQTYEVMQ